MKKYKFLVVIGMKINNMEILDIIKIEPRSLFLPDKSNFENSIYFFAYNIKIKNQGNEEVKLLSRYWDIKDANGDINIVEGKGVIGEQPILKPNSYYKYTSFCPLKTAFGSMEGFYTFSKENGLHFRAKIPEFSLVSPHNIN